jgi:hypothetical protein
VHAFYFDQYQDPMRPFLDADTVCRSNQIAFRLEMSAITTADNYHSCTERVLPLSCSTMGLGTQFSDRFRMTRWANKSGEFKGDFSGDAERMREVKSRSRRRRTRTRKGPSRTSSLIGSLSGSPGPAGSPAGYLSSGGSPGVSPHSSGRYYQVNLNSPSTAPGASDATGNSLGVYAGASSTGGNAAPQDDSLSAVAVMHIILVFLGAVAFVVILIVIVTSFQGYRERRRFEIVLAGAGHVRDISAL